MDAKASLTMLNVLKMKIYKVAVEVIKVKVVPYNSKGYNFISIMALPNVKNVSKEDVITEGLIIERTMVPIVYVMVVLAMDGRLANLIFNAVLAYIRNVIKVLHKDVGQGISSMV